MERNVGSTDKAVRVAVGAIAGLLSLAILAEAVSLPAILAAVLGGASLLLLATGVTGFCGLYSVLGLNTCPADAR